MTQGHATSQTTGIAGHMAARFIPTVERESIDLMYVSVVTPITVHRLIARQGSHCGW